MPDVGVDVRRELDARRRRAEEMVGKNGADAYFESLARQLQALSLPDEAVESLQGPLEELAELERTQGASIPPRIRSFYARSALMAAENHDLSGIEAWLDSARLRFRALASEEPIMRPRYKIFEWIGVAIGLLGLGGGILGYLNSLDNAIVRQGTVLEQHTAILNRHTELLEDMPERIGRAVAVAFEPTAERINRTETRVDRAEDRLRDLELRQSAKE